MKKRVLDVGNCVPDHAAIRRLLTGQFGAEVVQAHHVDDTLAALQQQAFDLVLVNRKLDQDYSDGLDVIRRIKAIPALTKVPVMMVTNYADQQKLAIEAGAIEGFGKLSLDAPETHARLRQVLDHDA